jgi:hypothetical protein
MLNYTNISKVILIIMFACFSVLGLNTHKKDAINIGSNRELFVDDYLIDKIDNLIFYLHNPIEKGKVISFDKPWEGSFTAYTTVLNDNGLYRLYYRGEIASRNIETTCYAESQDGITWSKPSLGIYEIVGSKENNVILTFDPPFSHNFSPFIDTKPGIPESQKYKAIAGKEETGLFGFSSPDGIHWQKLQDSAIISKGGFDSQNVAFWSASEENYICYFRSWKKVDTIHYRTVSRTTSKDFIHWTEPQHMDFGNAPLEQIYTNQTHPYFRAPQIYIALAARFVLGCNVLTNEEANLIKVNPKYANDCSDVIFMTSRGGNIYNRQFLDAFITPGIGYENWVSRTNYPALNIVQTGNSEMSLYVNKNYAQPTAFLSRYTLRLDGFVSLRAPYEGGEFITKPISFKGNNLIINYATSAVGSIQVELQNLDGKPISGYTFEESDIIIGNEINHIVSWKGQENLSKFSREPIRIKFKMKDTDLFSIWFN